MKRKLVLFASILTLNFFAVPRSNAQWVQTNCPEGDWCFAVSGTNIYTGLADFGGIYHSTDSGLSWTGVNTYRAGRTNVFAIAVNGSSLFVGTSDSGVFRSMDGGATWTSASVSLPHDSVYPAVYSLVVSESILFAGTDSGVFRSTNNGDSWTACDSGLTNTVSRIIVVNGSSLFVGMSHGLFLSTDNGTSWKQTGLQNTSVIAITISGSKLFASDGEFVFLSTDNGESWVRTNSSKLWLYTLATSGNDLFLGTAGVDDFLLSTDDGATWTSASDGLPKDQILALAVVGSNLIACTYGSAIYRRPLSDFGIAAVTPVNPLQNSLKSYPNPLSESTIITFTLPEASEVTLTITDAAGRETPLLHSTWMDAGQHEITWDATKIPSGVYLCRLSSGGENVTERVVVLK